MAEPKAVTETVPGLHDAAKSGELALVKELVGKGADVNEINVDGSSPLHLAAAYNHPATSKYLISRGALVESKTTNGALTPLHLAATLNAVGSMKALISSGSKVNARTEDNSTPLHFAAEAGHSKAVALLMKNGADSTLRDNREAGATPLLLAISTNSLGAVEALLENGADPSLSSKRGTSPIELANALGYSDIGILLKEYLDSNP